jgi:hypothetical protein
MEFESNSKSTSSLFNSREPSKEQESEDSLNILLNQSSSSISESKAAHKEDNKTNELIESAESALNEFYKLKNKYENEIMKNKKIIMNDISLSAKEKRHKYLQLKPKCINCKRPGGTIFSVKYYKNEDNEYRELRARCGIIADPCNLNITIQTGIYVSLPETIKRIEDEIKESKNIIIDSKNRLLFGYITTESAIQDFNDEKEIVDTYTSLLESYLNTYIKITDNAEKNNELKESLEQSYILIQEIKESIRLYNQTESTQYIKDAVTIYITKLQPLFKKIMELKYKQSFVYYDIDKNTFHLIQNKITIKSMEYSSFVDKVINYNVGYEPIQHKKKHSLIIESDSDENKQSPLKKSSPRNNSEEKFSLKPSIVNNSGNDSGNYSIADSDYND